MKTRWEIMVLVAGAASLGGCVQDLDGAPCPCEPGWCCHGAEGCKSAQEGACDVQIAFVPKASNNPVFRLAYEGASQAAREISVDFPGFHVDVPCMSSSELDSAQQAAAVERAIAAGPDGLIVSCLSNNDLKPLIASAAAQDIPTITYDSDCPVSERIAFYGIDNRQMGVNAADLLLKALFPTGDDGLARIQVAILSGDMTAENLLAREAGFTGELQARHPNVDMAGTWYCNSETAQECGTFIEDEIIEHHPDLDGLFVTGLWGLQSACTCDEKGMDCYCGPSLMPKWKAAADKIGGKLKTVACDALPFELTLMAEGYVSALISQDYFNWGHEPVSLMFERLTQGVVPKTFVEAQSVQVDSEEKRVDMLRRWEDVEPGPDLALACNVP